MYIHSVGAGEDLYSVAAEYGVSPEKLRAENGLTSDRLAEGDMLAVILPTRTYVVRAHEGIEDIAARFKVKTEDILALNPEMRGIPKIYTGQLLTLKSGGGEYGMAAANGYLYSGCTRSELVRALPYIDYLTVSAGVVRGGDVELIFDDSFAVETARAAGIIPLLRVYSPTLPRREDRADIIRSVGIIAKSRGYAGVTLGGNLSGGGPKETSEYILEARRHLMECDLLLFCEGAADGNTEYTDFSDGCLLTYDKIHSDNPPSFDSGERRMLTDFAERHDTPRVFVDISPFAYINGRYITKSKARALAARKRARLSYNEDTMILSAEGLTKRGTPLRYESAESVKAKLTLVSELGFMGISIDIGRFEPQDITLFRAMFGRLPEIYGRFAV